jgi:hypothetical protein
VLAAGARFLQPAPRRATSPGGSAPAWWMWSALIRGDARRLLFSIRLAGIQSAFSPFLFSSCSDVRSGHDPTADR